MNESAVLAARELLLHVTPLKTDCGRLCGGACCQGDDEAGMLLFPGEAALYENCGFARVVETEFTLAGERAKLLVCRGRCEREARPLSCRLFPLFLRFREDGSTRVVIDRRAKAVCPLTDYGRSGLDESFVKAARAAYDLLLQDAACAAWLSELDAAFKL